MNTLQLILEIILMICVVFVAVLNYIVSKKNREITEENMEILRIVDDMAMMITDERNHKGIQ